MVITDNLIGLQPTCKINKTYVLILKMKIKENSFFLETAEMGTFALLDQCQLLRQTVIDVVISANMYASELWRLKVEIKVSILLAFPIISFSHFVTTN